MQLLSLYLNIRGMKAGGLPKSLKSYFSFYMSRLTSACFFSVDGTRKSSIASTMRHNLQLLVYVNRQGLASVGLMSCDLRTSTKPA